jgi:ABC-type multidrug transport system fused ATPase/permease subunit
LRSELALAARLLSPAERRRGVLLIGLSVAGALVEALGLGAVFPFMSLLSDPSLADTNPLARTLYSRSGASSVERFVLLAACALLAAFVLKNAFLAVLYWVQARFASGFEARLGTDLLSAYLRAPYVSRGRRNSADQIRIITGEVNRAAAGFVVPALTIMTEGMVVIAIAILLLLVNPLAALLAAALVATVGVVMQSVFRNRLAGYRDVRVASLEAMFKSVNEGVSAVKEAKVLRRESFFVRRFARQTRDYARATTVFNTLNLLPRLVVETAAVGALLLTVIVAILTGGSTHELVPVLTLFGLAAVRLMPSGTRILSALNNLRFYAPAVREVAGDLKLAAALEPARAAAAPPAAAEPFATLELDRVGFTYPQSAQPALEDVEFRVSRGEIVAIVGRSGSGKTTLGDLLLGLLEPSHGTLRVNGRAVGSVHGEWQGMAGLVPQDFFLRDDTVRRNVAFGLDDGAIDDERVWRALERARLGERIRRLPDGLDSRIGERGALLSGGERQRISIARALYDDPAILVLDEATSALDAATEDELMNTLRELVHGKAIVVITHRAASAAKCDRVLVMAEGRIVADAPPALAELAQLDDDDAAPKAAPPDGPALTGGRTD